MLSLISLLYREDELPLFTVKIKAKRRPLGTYVFASIASIPISAFWAWAAYSGLGFSLAIARQVFIVFTALHLIFCPLLYLANERQVRDHSSKLLLATATASSASFAAAVLYFLAMRDHEIVFGIVYGTITIGVAVCFLLFAIRWEFE